MVTYKVNGFDSVNAYLVVACFLNANLCETIETEPIVRFYEMFWVPVPVPSSRYLKYR